ncbi:hypothetical protein NQD34_015241 [Periophthalmus magnuspinnatus]|nr:hypothetical protein NQD34_015241 [Periophthalmus magnuspinnatus]
MLPTLRHSSSVSPSVSSVMSKTSTSPSSSSSSSSRWRSPGPSPSAHAANDDVALCDWSFRGRSASLCWTGRCTGLTSPSSYTFKMASHTKRYWLCAERKREKER